jgi:hypothetical protein
MTSLNLACLLTENVSVSAAVCVCVCVCVCLSVCLSVSARPYKPVTRSKSNVSGKTSFSGHVASVVFLCPCRRTGAVNRVTCTAWWLLCVPCVYTTCVYISRVLCVICTACCDIAHSARYALTVFVRSECLSQYLATVSPIEHWPIGF